MDDNAPVRLESNRFWGKRSGSWDRSIPKGLKDPVGNCFWQRQFTCGRNNNMMKPRSPARILSEQALRMGWHNGVRLSKNEHQNVEMKKKIEVKDAKG